MKGIPNQCQQKLYCRKKINLPTVRVYVSSQEKSNAEMVMPLTQHYFLWWHETLEHDNTPKASYSLPDNDWYSSIIGLLRTYVRFIVILNQKFQFSLRAPLEILLHISSFILPLWGNWSLQKYPSVYKCPTFWENYVSYISSLVFVSDIFKPDYAIHPLLRATNEIC